MAVLNEGLQFRLLAGDLKNTGTILESVMRVRQHWELGLWIDFRTGNTQFVTREICETILALATWYCSSSLYVSVKDLLSSTGGSETRHLTNHTH